jgi:SagB-type dehydrogenase family enzyme
VRQPHAPLVRAELYGEDEPSVDDPAELFHEASKLYPALAARQSMGMARLAASDELQTMALHATRRNPHLPSMELPAPMRPEYSFWSTLELRRSRRSFATRAVDLRAIATLLDAAYGDRGGRRTVPSGGALYPLELYLLAARVAGLGRGVYRYDAGLHALERRTAEDPWPSFVEASAAAGLVDDGAAALLVLGVFGRTRFKYGVRGYRFALLEAGHVVQNVVLAASALDVATLPYGGYYDFRLDELVGADGVDESVVYAVVIGAS